MIKKEDVKSTFDAMSFTEKMTAYYSAIADYQDAVKKAGKSDAPEAAAIFEVLKEMAAYADTMKVESENDKLAFMLGGFQVAGIRNMDEDSLKADIRGLLAEMQAGR